MQKFSSLLANVLATSTVFAATGPANTFNVQAINVPKNGTIPTQYTCDGADISPALHWGGAPANTESYVLVLSDPDAPGGTFYHWAIYDLPKALLSLPEGAKTLPQGASYGKNSWNRPQYNGPCPPRGTIHRYIFALYALDTVLSLPAGTPAKSVLAAMKPHVLATAEWPATFGH